MNPTRLLLCGLRRTTHFPKTVARSIKFSSSPSTAESDPFTVVDRLNGTHKSPPKTIPKRATYSSPSTSIPLSPTTDSPGQSSAIEAHPSTSAQDLHPLPSSTPIHEADHSQASSSLSQAADLGDATVDWSRSFSGLSQQPFSKDASDILMAPINPMDVEIKPGKSCNQLPKNTAPISHAVFFFFFHKTA